MFVSFYGAWWLLLIFQYLQVTVFWHNVSQSTIEKNQEKNTLFTLKYTLAQWFIKKYNGKNTKLSNEVSAFIFQMTKITFGCLDITHLMISPEVKTTVCLNSRVNSYKKQLWTKNKILESVRCFSGEDYFIYKWVELIS